MLDFCKVIKSSMMTRNVHGEVDVTVEDLTLAYQKYMETLPFNAYDYRCE